MSKDLESIKKTWLSYHGAKGDVSRAEDSYLSHYGIKGMKWGVRRYQNSDGTLTEEGKARYKAEYKEDNATAFLKGKNATVLANAAEYARKYTDRAAKRYEKNPSDKNKAILEANKRVKKILDKNAKDSLKDAKTHYEKLVEKYGSEAVSKIKYNKKGLINEPVATADEKARALGITLASLGASMGGGVPVFVVAGTASAKEMGERAYHTTYINVYNEMRRNGEWYK